MLHTKLAPSTVWCSKSLLDMSGFQVLPHLVNSGRTHIAPVIVLTHLTNPFILDLAVKNGTFSALCKSFTPADILDKHILRSLSCQWEGSHAFAIKLRLLFFLSYGQLPLQPLTRTVDSSHSPSVAYHNSVISLRPMSLMQPVTIPFEGQGTVPARVFTRGTAIEQCHTDGSCVGGSLEPSLRISIPSIILAILNYWLMLDHNWTSCHH